MSKYMLLKDHVYNYIVEQINAGEMVAGKKLNESAISKNLQVSRTPVREALIQLASDGLLENVPRKGFIIKAPIPTLRNRLPGCLALSEQALHGSGC